jgi:transposase
MFEFLWSGANEASKRLTQGEEPLEQAALPPDVDTGIDSWGPSWESVVEILPEPSAAEPSATPRSDTLPEKSPPSAVAASAPLSPELSTGATMSRDAGPLPRLPGRRRGRRLVKKDPLAATPLTAQQRLLLLDTWQRSGLPARDFAALVGVSKHTLYAWKKKFAQQGPAGLLDQPRGGPKGSKLPELTRRTILMLKEANPSWGCQRISDMLARGPALPASASAVARVLHEAGYELEEVATRPHPDKVRHFERARPNQLWQTDLFTFTAASSPATGCTPASRRRWCWRCCGRR